jgi:hypothetical protein
MQGVCGAATSHSVRRRAALMSIIVGTLLGLINHGEAIFQGTISPPDTVRVIVTYIVPYCVSTVSSVLAALENQRI